MASDSRRGRTIIYVDGFNLYYGCLKSAPYRWLDVAKLADLMLPGHTVTEVKYFTAIVDDPKGSVRQQVYIGAIEASGRVTTYRGHFLSHPKVKKRAQVCEQCAETHATVIVTEEKGTDVNIATHLVYDACTDAMDTAVVISNDSDLVMPIRFAREKCGKKVGLINPQRHPAQALRKEVDFYKKIRAGALKECQLPPVVEKDGRRFVKPKEWE